MGSTPQFPWVPQGKTKQKQSRAPQNLQLPTCNHGNLKSLSKPSWACQLVQRGGQKEYYLKGFWDQLGRFAMALRVGLILPTEEDVIKGILKRKLTDEEGVVFKKQTD